MHKKGSNTAWSLHAGMPTSEGTPTSVVTLEAEGMSTTAGSQQQQKRQTQQKRQQLHDLK
jgi:hypothetical protein